MHHVCARAPSALLLPYVLLLLLLLMMVTRWRLHAEISASMLRH
jgi:hypothetical protein